MFKYLIVSIYNIDINKKKKIKITQCYDKEIKKNYLQTIIYKNFKQSLNLVS